MKIDELIFEVEIPNALRDVELADIFGVKLTAGDVADFIPGVDPRTVIQYGKNISDTVQQKIVPGYTVGDALLDAATVIPAVKIAGAVLKGGRATAGAATAVGRRQVGQEVAKDVASKGVTVNPELARSAKSPAPTPAPAPAPTIKRARKRVGDTVTVPYNGKRYQAPIIEVLPNGYVVNAEPILQRPGAKMTVKDPG